MGKNQKESCDLLVKLDGKEEVRASDTDTWKLRNGTDIMALVIDQRLDMPDEFEIRFVARAEGKHAIFDWAKEGTKVELAFSYEKPIQPMFTGEVTYADVEYHADAEMGAFVSLRGYDKSHRLHRSHEAKAYGTGDQADQDPAQVASDIVQNSGAIDASDGLNLSPGDAGVMSKYLPALQTPFESIKQLYGQTPSADHSADGTIIFNKLSIQSNPVATICYEGKGKGVNPIGVMSARFSIATYPIYAKVRVRGWDPKEKKAFVEEITSCSPDIDGAQANSGWESGWKATGKALYNAADKGAVYDRVANWCETKDEAKQLAQSIFDQYSLQYLTGDVVVEGCPDIQPGVVVQFAGFGDRVNGKVMVTSATHSLDAKANQTYTTSFAFCSNAAKPAK